MQLSNLISLNFTKNKILRALKSSIPYVFLFILSLGVFFKPVSDLDELWNYNFSRCIFDGLVPYNDFNILQTPLAAYVSSFFLCVFGNDLFRFRIAAFCLLFVTFVLLYKLCSLISKNKILSFGFVILAFSINFSRWIYNYNYFILLLSLLVIFFEYIRLEKADEKHVTYINAVEGILIGLIPLFKQSTGAIFVFVNVLICLYEWFKNKNNLKSHLLRIGLSVVPSVIFVLVLLLTETFSSFYDYAIAGIKDFTHSITYLDYILSSPISFVIGIFPVVVIICFGFCYVKNKLKVSRAFAVSLFCLSIAGCVVAYPICDSQHFPVAVVPFILCFLCCDFKFSKRWIISLFCGANVLVAVFTTCMPVFLAFGDFGYVKSNLLHYENLPIKAALEDNISIVDDYIIEQEKQGNTVYIADSTAAAYMIPLNRYNKNFDLLMLGNLGTNSIDDLLEDKTGSIILVQKDESVLNYQSHIELIQYIKSNFEYLEDVQSFEAYLISR